MKPFLFLAVSALFFSPLGAVELKLVVPDDASPAARAAVGKIVSTTLTAEERIAGILGVPESKRIKTLTMHFKKMPGVAHASGGELFFSIEHLERQPDDAAGVGVHELTHIVQGYAGNYRGANVWITEGMADYVRFGVFEGGRYGFRHDPTTQNYDSSYRITGRFMGWCETQKPGLVKALHAAISKGGDGVAAWESFSGEKLPVLWKRYCDAQ